MAKLAHETLLRGRSSLTMISAIRKEMNVSKASAKRLVVTETARLQTQAQKDVYLVNEFEEYEYIAEPSACPICKALDGKTFKVKSMEPGENASPMHPHCHCSTAPYVDEVKFWSEMDELVLSDEEKQELYRNKDNNKRRPVNIVKQNKLTKPFREKGGMVWQDKAALEYLRARNAQALNLGADTIVLQPRATISEILEELYHAEQWRLGILKNGDPFSVIKAEIQAQHYLLSISKRYNIPKNEIKETERNLEYWKRS